MDFPRSLILLCAISTVCTVVSALRAKRTPDIEARVTSFTFDEFIEDFGRTYDVGSAEYLHRYEVFEESMAQIVAKNARESPSWTAGVHPFMDLTDEERLRLHGYKPSGARKSGIISLELEMNEMVYGGSGDSFQVTMPPVLNQGSLCGSCWAIAATQAVEMQLMKTDNPTREHLYGSPMRLSTQAVLECAQIENPHNCGGPGGCKGSTSEVAFDYIRDHGIPLSSEHPYHPNPEKLSKQCPLQPYPANWARVTIDGWKELPSNKAQPLMQALVEDGAVIVAIDSHNLYPYSSGIFDDCPKDAVVSHALLATGYGEDAGQKYWSLQNSWGLQWGEGGSVRVLRHNNEDQFCGTDNHPEEGFACDGETKPVTVCGTCGILFDMVIPSGPQVQAPQQTSSDPSSSVTQANSNPPSQASGAHAPSMFSTWTMPPPSAVELSSADAQVDGYLSTPAPDLYTNQAIITTPPATQTDLPDFSIQAADQQQQQQGGAIDAFMPTPQAVLVPSSVPSEAPSSTGLEPAIQTVVDPSSVHTKSQLPSVFDPDSQPPDVPPSPDSAAHDAPTSTVAKMQQILNQHALESQPDVPPSAPDSSAVSDAPTSVVAKMQQNLKQHGALPEDVLASPAEEQGNSNALPPAEPTKLNDVLPPVQVASAEAKQPAVEGKVVQSDSSIEHLWDELPEGKLEADASHAAPIQQEALADQHIGSDFEMPTPTTFAHSLDQFNVQSKSLDSPDDQSSPMHAESTDPSSPPGASITDGMKGIFSDYKLE